MAITYNPSGGMVNSHLDSMIDGYHYVSSEVDSNGWSIFTLANGKKIAKKQFSINGRMNGNVGGPGNGYIMSASPGPDMTYSHIEAYGINDGDKSNAYPYQVVIHANNANSTVRVGLGSYTSRTVNTTANIVMTIIDF